MNFIDEFMEKWNRFCEKSRPTIQRAGEIASRIGGILLTAWNYLFKFRKVFLGAPVGAIAVYLAVQNMVKLPVIVGLDLQQNGEFSIQIMREIAVLGPMAFTALCLLLMFCSRRILTPWLVSVFSLALPLLILLVNTFPA